MSLLPCSKARDAEPFAVKTGSAATGLKSKAEPSPNTRFCTIRANRIHTHYNAR